MKRTIPALLAIAFPILFAACDRREVTSSESLPAASPDWQPGAGPMSAPVGLPDIVQKANPQAVISEEENTKF